VDYSQINRESVAWATDNGRELLKAENDRLQALDAKAGQLSGFSGVILAVLGSIAPDAFDRNIGAVGEPLFASAYFASVGALTGAILWLVFFALRPQRSSRSTPLNSPRTLRTSVSCALNHGRCRCERSGPCGTAHHGLSGEPS